MYVLKEEFVRNYTIIVFSVVLILNMVSCSEKLVKFFFEIHDPTQVNGQGPDIGKQYLSAIFYKNDAEKKIIKKLIDILKNKGYKIVTKVLPDDTFWKAEEYHQNYYDKKKQQPYCHVYKKKF